MFTLPPGFVTVQDAWDTVGTEKFCNVIAVVVDSLAPAKTRRDWTVKVTLSDHSGFSGLGAPFRFFNMEEHRLPPFGTRCENGDVVVLRNFKVKDLGGVIGLTNTSTEWTVIKGPQLATSEEDKLGEVAIFRPPIGHKLGPPTQAELLYAKQILESTDPSTIQGIAPRTALEVANTMTAAGGTAPKSKDKFSLVKDIVPSSHGDTIFKDIFGEVRRIYKTDSRMSIYITDYTSHDLLYDYQFGHDVEGPEGDRFNYVQETTKTWPGPHGKKTILVTLWDAHAVFAHKELQEGNYVLLKNVHVKMDRRGSLMEGHCRGDKMNMTKVNVIIIKPVEAESNELLRDLLRRKRAVETAEGPKFASHPTNLKRRAEATAAINEATVSSKATRNKNTRNKKRRGKARATDSMEASDGNEPQSRSETGFLLSANTEVRIMNIEVPCKPIHEIVDREILARKTVKGNTFYLPFQNCRYKSKVRVVDFFPDNLADFSAPYRDSEYSMLSDQEDSDSDIEMTQLNDYDIKWEWRFFLVVEDASRPSGQQAARMELLIAGTDGDYLLNMDACDLRKNDRELNVLKEKLFVLWGDLQELKEEASKSEDVTVSRPRARPFECLITEYGIKTRDEDGVKKGNSEYERMFRISGTTIK